jgi:hypothetical protein
MMLTSFLRSVLARACGAAEVKSQVDCDNRSPVRDISARQADVVQKMVGECRERPTPSRTLYG